MKLLIATTNPAKVTELKKYLEPLFHQGRKIVSLKDLNHDIEEPEETGTTLEENAELKARYYAEQTGLPALADDGGFEIDILNGEPGVKSNRWLGYKASDEELIAYTLKRLQGVPFKDRTARGALVLCYYNPQTGTLHRVREGIEGYMAEETSGRIIPGFPYRALFKVKAFGNKYYDELTEDEHNAINHRKKAVEQIIPLIQQDLVQ
jgi:XTP/dITP diphosphohydrolase